MQVVEVHVPSPSNVGWLVWSTKRSISEFLGLFRGSRNHYWDVASGTQSPLHVRPYDSKQQRSPINSNL